MTPQELRDLFKIGIDKASPDSYSGELSFIPEEEEAIINRAYIEVVKGKYSGDNKLNVTFNDSTIVASELSGLIRNAKLENIVADDINSIYIELSTNVEVQVEEEVVVEKKPINELYIIEVVLVGTKVYSAKEIQSSTTNKYIATAENKPIIPEPVYLIENGAIKVYMDPIDTDEITYAKVRYIKKPSYISLSSTEEITEVKYDMLLEVVDRAVQIALENMESPRVQLQAQLDMAKSNQAITRMRVQK
jgi:hypothetical protein